MTERNQLWYDQNMFDLPESVNIGREEYKQDNTYFDAISAAWQLEPIGQYALDDDSFMDSPYDPPENIEEKIEAAGMREYADAFYDIRNEKHFTYVKEKINYNNQLRSIRDDGGIMPEIIAALGDPLTYVPIPFVKGISFLPRFAKGAGLSMGVTAAAEPIRHGYDPTATAFESVMYVGGAGLLGGSMIAAFGRRGIKGIDDFNATKKTQEQKTEHMLKSFHDTETNAWPSDIYEPDTPGTYNIGGKSEWKIDVGNQKVNKKDADRLTTNPIIFMKNNILKNSKVSK